MSPEVQRKRPKRPAIPVEIARAVLIECGHRCAVCGAECPLERAHIVPWRDCQKHTFDNLICLCANCHARADFEKWGPQTLKDYKEKPWVLRQKQPAQQTRTAKLRLQIDLNFADFDERQRRFLQFAIAAFLETDPEDVRIVEVQEGSVYVTVEVPRGKLAVSACRYGTKRLAEALLPMHLLSIEAIQKGDELIVAALNGNFRASIMLEDEIPEEDRQRLKAERRKSVDEAMKRRKIKKHSA